MIRLAIHEFIKELGYDISIVDTLISNIETGNIHVCYETDGKGITGIIGFDNNGAGELFWVRPDKRNTAIAIRLFNAGHHKAKEQGFNKTVIYSTPERAKMYQKRGYSITHLIMEKTLC